MSIPAILLALVACAAALGVVFGLVTRTNPVRSAISFVLVSFVGCGLVGLAAFALGVRA
jgi:hypothetical protein